jgi:hypothetical protein
MAKNKDCQAVSKVCPEYHYKKLVCPVSWIEIELLKRKKPLPAYKLTEVFPHTTLLFSPFLSITFVTP